jgi:hypothetical protein
MTPRRLMEYMEELTSTGDYVLSHPHPDPLTASWLDAEADAVAAYEMWSVEGDAESYAVYRAYADQADAAQDALAAAHGRAIA